MPASCFMRSMREHGPLIWLPTQVGTATQWPVDLARYSTVGFTVPFNLISSAMMSSTGSRRLTWSAGCQLVINVMTRSRLRLGGDGQQVLVALPGDVIDRDPALLLAPPSLARRAGGLVAARPPRAPEADGEPAGSVGAVPMRHRDSGGRARRCREETTARHLALEH